MIRFHRAGRKILLVSAVLLVLMSVILVLFLPLLPYLILQTALLVIAFLVFRFFRYPARKISSSMEYILAPADGKIVAIEQVTESEYFRDERIQVSIFMSIHNVHINWYPIHGIVKYFKYHSGKYLLARHPKSSNLNERSSTVISNEHGEILVRQIAGYVARRIICNAKPGQKVDNSMELGFIKFGSRLDVILPLDTEVLVDIGQKSKGGITKLAKLQ